MYAEQLEAIGDKDSTNRCNHDSCGTSGSYRPESPFLPEPRYEAVAQAVSISTGGNTPFDSAIAVVETPFISQYLLEGEATESYENALHRELVEELYDEEFEEAIEDLIDHLRGEYELQFQGELNHSPAEAEHRLALYLKPLEDRIVAGIDQMIADISPIDTEVLDEIQLDNFLENFEYEVEFEEPAFDNFFKKIFKKIKNVAKKVVKKGVGIVKKGIKVLKKFSPIHIILGKLKKLVRPLLKRVLKFALNKVPVRFRPLAKRLARRFMKGALGEIPESEFESDYFTLEDPVEQSEMMAMDAEAATPAPAIIGAEFDTLIAGYIAEGEDFEFEPAVALYLSGEDLEEEHAADYLDNARDRFIREVGNAESEEEVVAAVEHFIPAILAGLKIGIKIIGRRRVVNFLAKLVAKLIRRFVGPQAAVPLSRALVDAGLKLVSLESPEEMAYAAGETVAATVQETVDMFVTEAPPEAFEDDELAEVYVQEMFDRAVARNFPPQLVRRDLRRVLSSRGSWILMPRGRRRKHYKKFTEIVDITITPQIAKRVQSFGGDSLFAFLKEQLGLPIDRQAVNAKLHLYEGIRGTSLSDISHLEKGVEGLGSRDRSAWMQLHPFTRRAAALLSPKHVGLGRRVSRRFLARRTQTAVGQRFYYLEISGARLIRAPVKPAEKVGSRKPGLAAAAKASEVNVVIDFGVKEVRLYDFFSEVSATQLSQRIRKGQSRVAVVRAIRSSLVTALGLVMSDSAGKHLKIKREAPAEDGFIAKIAPILRFVGRTISTQITNFVVKQLMSEMKKTGNALAKDFVAAAESPEDGVTIVFTLSQIGEVFSALSGNPLRRVRALAKLRTDGISGAIRTQVLPGFHDR